MANNHHKLMAAGTAALIAEPALALMHTGPVGVIVGLAVGAVAYNLVDDLERMTVGKEGELSSPSPEIASLPTNAKQDTSFMYRLLNGKSIRGDGEQAVSTSQPAEAINERLHTTPGHLALGAMFQPHADSILSKRLGMFGIPGSGKSNAMRVFCEELGKLGGVGVPFILADTEGEYSSICTSEYLARPFQAHAGNVTTQNAFQFGQEVLQRGLQVILDLQSYESDDEAALVMIELIKGLRAYAEAQENASRASCMFILDEASIWLPQNQQESMLSKAKEDNILAQLQQQFFGTVVRRGRKRGIGFLFATQRIAEIDKRCVQCDWLFLFRQTMTNDISRYAELGIPKEATPALAPGEAFVIEPDGAKNVRVLRRSYSPDNSVTPGLASLHQKAEKWNGSSVALPQEPVRQVNALALPITTTSLFEQMAITLLQNGYPLEQVMTMLKREQPSAPIAEIPKKAQPSEEDILLEKGIEAFQEGYNSIDKLAAALDITRDKARKLKPRIEQFLARQETQSDGADDL